MTDLKQLRTKDKRYLLLSFKQIVVAELAKNLWLQGSALTYREIEKVFNGKQNVIRCIEKLKLYKIIRQSPENPRVFFYIPVEEIDGNQTLLEAFENVSS